MKLWVWIEKWRWGRWMRNNVTGFDDEEDEGEEKQFNCFEGGRGKRMGSLEKKRTKKSWDF